MNDQEQGHLTDAARQVLAAVGEVLKAAAEKPIPFEEKPPEITDYHDPEQLRAYTAYMDRRRAFYKTQERGYDFESLPVQWWRPDPPIEFWEAGPGIYGAIVAGGFCAFNGYVLLPEGHPWRETNLQSWEWDERAPQPGIHGGITFQHTTGWIGFDTGHAWDHWEWPLLQQLRDEGKVPDFLWERWVVHRQIEVTVNRKMGQPDDWHIGHGDDWDIHWTLPLLRKAVEELALQVHLTTPSGEKSDEQDKGGGDQDQPGTGRQ